MVMARYGRKHLTVSHHLAIFGSHCSGGNIGITYLLFHVNPKDHLNKESRDFRIGSSSVYVTSLPSLVTIDTIIVEICF